MTAFFRSQPVATALAVVVVLAWLVGADHEFGAAHPELLLLVTALGASNPGLCGLVVVALIGPVGAVERRLLGSRQTASAYTLCLVGGAAIGLAAQHAGLLTRGLWETPTGGALPIDPFAPIVGTILAGSAFCSPQWRLRIRLLGAVGLLSLLLYSGQPSDFYRAAAGFVGIVAGFAAARNRPVPVRLRSRHHEARTVITALTVLTALGPFAALTGPDGYGLLGPFGRLFNATLAGRAALDCRGVAACATAHVPMPVAAPAPILLSLLPLFVLLAAAAGIWRGRRAAAIVAIVVNAGLAALAAVYFGLLPYLLNPNRLRVHAGTTHGALQTALGVFVPLSVAAATAAMLRHCRVPTRVGALVGSGAAAGTALITLSACYLATATLPGEWSRQQTPLGLEGDLLDRFVPVGFLRLERTTYRPVGEPARLLWEWMGPAVWLVVLLGLVACVLNVATASSPADEQRVRALLRRGSVGSIAHMTTWPGNRYWFSPDGRHAVAFRATSNLAVTVGEPIGPPDGSRAAALDFVRYCDDIGVQPVFYTVRPEFVRALELEGRWSSVVVGDDTIIDPTAFSLEGNRWKGVRTSINRADRAGIRAIWTDWSRLAQPMRTQVESIAAEWIARRQLPELEFTVGGLEQLKDSDVKLMVAIDAHGRIEAVTSWLPTYCDGVLRGLTLDFMRRRQGSMNGAVEFLIASTLIAAQQWNLDSVSLSIAPLVSASVGQQPSDRAVTAVARMLEPFYGFASLATFKEKFQPDLRPVMMTYPDAFSLPVISLALGRIYLPDLSIAKAARLIGSLL